jgi:6-phosphogluconolactonase (cycloisomerase 2 family)
MLGKWPGCMWWWIGAALIAGLSLSAACGHSVDFGVAPPGQPGPPLHQFAYVSNQGDDKISEFSIDSKTGALKLIGTASAGSASGLTGLVATFRSHLVFASNPTDSTISAFKFVPSGKSAGILKPLKVTSTGAGTAPTALALNLTGTFLYATDVANNKLFEYSINGNTGALKPIGAGSVPTGKMPVSVVASAHSNALFVANSGDGTISGFSIDTHGALKATGFIGSLGGSTPAAPQWLAVDSTGTGIYDADMFPGPGGSVSAFTLAGSGTALVFVTGGPFPTTNLKGFPAWVTVDSPARFVYTANPFPNNNLSIYKIQSNAGLSTAVLAPVPALKLNSVVSDATGAFLYVTDVGQGFVFQFSINSSTGVPTAIAGSPVSTESPPNAASHPFQVIVTR